MQMYEWKTHNHYISVILDLGKINGTKQSRLEDSEPWHIISICRMHHHYTLVIFMTTSCTSVFLKVMKQVLFLVNRKIIILFTLLYLWYILGDVKCYNHWTERLWMVYKAVILGLTVYYEMKFTIRFHIPKVMVILRGLYCSVNALAVNIYVQ